MKVVVVGDAGLDVVARHDGPVVHGGDTRATVRLAGGGAGANTALWLAEAGTAPTLVARVGDDAGGRMMRAELEAAGVDCAFAADPDEATCCVIVLVDENGQRSMLPDRGANKRLAEADITSSALEGAAHLHLSGYVLLDPSSRPAGLAALHAARAAGLSTSVDPQSAALLTDPAAFLADIEGVDLLLPNEVELAALAGSPGPADARRLLGTVGAVVVTSGFAGATWIGADEVVSVEAERVDCVDSTGAGDAFNAGLLSAWLHGKSTVDSLRSGVALGTRAVSVIGAQPQRRQR
ncbi:ribokinase [Prauserella marina]|uniref:Sugar or nucleoside kinase, ribokinase family n=1 Tax=Prauserella marina TaxID=530584 RepID=A0A222VNX5_9PSEU|nr:PfkB family carbohydrate kinase [Prauserella marina]ASR35453.1 ribokinase [Prauserella marina]PWV84734.1 sugar/nucleoside kinase (ribokinase family) [Prauserella marina]SDC14531.1 Sugar or nucleoside kinase, ribokinase family [Prauserella marina]